MNPGIEAARLLLALSVVLFHYDYALPSAYLAVDVFFVVSGLVIGMRYEGRLRSGMTMRRFVRGRLIRLCPLYGLSVLLGMAGAYAQRSVAGGSFDMAGLFWRAALMVPWAGTTPIYPGEAESFPLNPAVWSLWCEIAANAAFAALCRLPRWAMHVPILAGAVALSVAACTFDNLSVGGDAATFGYGLARVGFAFFAGVCLARHPATWRIGPIGFTALCAVVTAFLAVWPVAPGYTGGTLVFILLGGPALARVFAAARLPPAVHRVCLWGGSLSYALYICHVPLQRIVLAVGEWLGYGRAVTASPAGAVVMCVGLIGVSWLATAWFDAPVRRWLNRGQAANMPSTRIASAQPNPAAQQIERTGATSAT